MKTYNIWECDEKHHGPTGPWKFLQAVVAKNAEQALAIARSRFGLHGHYNVYES